MTYEEDIRNALKYLREGGVILYPTDTVWGLGCDPSNEKAVSEIFRIKERSDSKSLILLVNNEYMLERYVREIPEAASQITSLSYKPVTIIYPEGKNMSDLVKAEDGSVGIRISSDPFCCELIERFRKPLVSTSANKSGRPAPALFEEITEDIISSVSYVVHHRREDRLRHSPSPVLKIGLKGEIQIIRK